MKILGSDYDGTLTCGGMNETKLSAIEKWRKAGHKFGIVSGRGKDFRKDLLQQIPQLKLDFFAAYNGGYITDENDFVIFEARCNEVALPELVADLFAWKGKRAFVNGRSCICILAKPEDRPSYISEEAAFLLENCPTVDYFNQVSVLLSSIEDASVVVEKIKKKYAKWLNPLQNGKIIDIVPTGINKAQGMYRVMEFFGGTYGDVITVGDNVNDIDMIREFRSYAMKNGVEEARNLADGIVSDVMELLEKELSF